MKPRWTKKVVFIAVAYISVFLGLAAVWDMRLANWDALATAIAGLLTIVGGFLLAYWLIESNRLSKEFEKRNV